jgi:hypothetical protein
MKSEETGEYRDTAELFTSRAEDAGAINGQEHLKGDFGKLVETE